MISVIIPARNEENVIGNCLKSLRSQDFKGAYEIIVIDGHSKDRTVAVASRYTHKVYKMHPRGPGAARNDGARVASYPILAFIDADCIAPKHWLGQIEKDFEENEIIGLGGVLRPLHGRLIDRVMFRINSNWWLRLSAKLGLYQLTGNNCMYKKREFLRIGGFNIHVSFFEDTELSMRMIKEGKLMVDGELWVRTSTRRFRQMGYVKLFKINMTAFISALLRKPITTEYFESRKKKK